MFGTPKEPYLLSEGDIVPGWRSTSFSRECAEEIRNTLRTMGIKKQTIEAQSIFLRKPTIEGALRNDPRRLKNENFKILLRSLEKKGVIRLPEDQTLETLLEMSIEPYLISDMDIVPAGKGVSFSKTAAQEIRNTIENMGVTQKHIEDTARGAEYGIPKLYNVYKALKVEPNPWLKKRFKVLLESLKNNGVIRFEEGQTPETLLEMSIEPYLISKKDIVPGWRSTSFSGKAAIQIKNTLKNMGITLNDIAIFNFMLTEDMVVRALSKRDTKFLRNPTFMILLRSLEKKGVIRLPEDQTLETLLEMSIEPYTLSKKDIIVFDGNKASFSEDAAARIVDKLEEMGVTKTKIELDAELSKGSAWVILKEKPLNPIRKERFNNFLNALITNGVIKLPEGQTLETLLEKPTEPSTPSRVAIKSGNRQPPEGQTPETLLEMSIEPYPLSENGIIVFDGNKASFSEDAAARIVDKLEEMGVTKTKIELDAELSKGSAWVILKEKPLNPIRKERFNNFLNALITNGVIKLPEGQTLETLLEKPTEPSTPSRVAIKSGNRQPPEGQTPETLLEMSIEPYPLSKGDIVFGRKKVSFSEEAGREIQSSITQKQGLTQEIIGQSCDLSGESICYALSGQFFSKQIFANILMALMEHGVIQLPEDQDLGQLLYPEAESSYTTTDTVVSIGQNCAAVGGGEIQALTALLQSSTQHT